MKRRAAPERAPQQPPPPALSQLITDRAFITRKYLWGWFGLDLASTIPYDLFTTYLVPHDPSDHSNSQLRLLGFLKTPRLLRLAKLLKFFDKFQGAQYFKLVRLTMFILMISHWIACGYCLLAEFESSYPTWVEYTKMTQEGDPQSVAEGDILELYAMAFYQAWTMLTGVAC